MSEQRPRMGAVKQITSHSNPIIKEIKGLVALRKHRTQSGLFVAEGLKLATDALDAGWTVRYLALGPEARDNPIAQKAAATAKSRGALILEVNTPILEAITRKENPQMVVGVYEQQLTPLERIDPAQSTVWIALDRVRDPGNLGTIIRIADWFGIKNIFCSTATVDAYNPKTVQATMGALARVNIHYVDLVNFLSEKKKTPIYGTFLDGTDIYTQDLKPNGIIVMGNEGNGISPEIAKQVNEKIKIPNYPKNTQTSESLNVAVATAIVCAEFRRKR